MSAALLEPYWEAVAAEVRHGCQQLAHGAADNFDLRLTDAEGLSLLSVHFGWPDLLAGPSPVEGTVTLSGNARRSGPVPAPWNAASEDTAAAYRAKWLSVYGALGIAQLAGGPGEPPTALEPDQLIAHLDIGDGPDRDRTLRHACAAALTWPLGRPVALATVTTGIGPRPPGRRRPRVPRPHAQRMAGRARDRELLFAIWELACAPIQQARHAAAARTSAAWQAGDEAGREAALAEEAALCASLPERADALVRATADWDGGLRTIAAALRAEPS